MRCQVPDCTGLSRAKGMCDKHYRRLKKHGLVQDPRPSDWGERRKNPLYDSWRWVRKRTGNGCVPRWDDFWAFVEDVGERPSPHHSLQRLDKSAIWGPENFYWHERLTCSKDRTKYDQAYRKKNPLAVKSSELKKQFGITIEDYMDMLDKQGGKCAICDSASTGRYKYFAVDHCHNTGEIRGLLCDKCNRGIGLLGDDPHVLAKAISYLN